MEEGDNDENRLPEPDLENAVDVEFRAENHSSEMLSKMNDLRMTHSDTQIEIGPRVFNVHKLVLMAESPYFNKFFIENGSPDYVKMNQQDVSPAAFEILLNFMYKSVILLSDQNVSELMAASRFLQMKKAIKYCLHFLAKRLNLTNALKMYKMAQEMKSEELEVAVVKFVSSRLEALSVTEDFLEANFEVIFEIFCSKFLMFAAEEDIFISALNWIKHEPESRKEKISDFLKILKLKLINRHFLVKVIGQEKIIRENPECYSQVVQMYETVLMPPENFGKDPGPYQRVNPLDRDLKILGPEDLGQGPTVKVFDNKTLIIGIEFRLTDNAIAGIRRRSEKSVTWHVQIQHWNDQFETWELMNQSAFRTDVSTEKNQTVAKLRFIRRIRTKHLKIHVANAPQNTFTIAFQTAR